ncbi:unnamed protein product [Porites lobata]|uniref:ShKT domain-containing protein n=1 Tax=Porites lobata TaxID=104759 RepID=A0ABN8MTW3_9CNID|nr:unnamed protein product [Porites lobata]
MKASYGFVLLSLLFAFSWGKYIQRTRLGIPKQAVREESTDVQPVEQTVFQVDSDRNIISQEVISKSASCVDKSPSCGYWALIGECTKNPGYMLTSCCVWCNHMKTLKNIASTSCTDEDANCGVWANKGECCKNPAYMLERCCAACKDKVTFVNSAIAVEPRFNEVPCDWEDLFVISNTSI